MGKKVLFVASVAKKHIRQFHLPYLKWFGEQGYEVHVCAGDDFENGEDKTIPYCDSFFELPFSRSPYDPKNFKVFCELKRLINSEHYEIIHCHTPVAAALTRMAAVRARRSGTKLIYTAHGFHFFKGAPPVSKLYYIIEKTLAPLTDVLITINREDYEAARSFCEKCSCESYLLHGVGVDTVKIRNTSVDAAELRRSLGIPADAFVVMTTAEINFNKNIATGIKAFSKVRRDNMYYLICGSGDAKASCQQLAEELGIKDSVIFAGYRYDVFSLLHIADVFLFPSYREGLGVAAVEAMSAGLPVIASDIRGVTEYAVDGVNSLLFAPDDTDGFASAIDRLERDRELRRKMGEAALMSVDKFDLQNSLAVMSAIYCGCLGLDKITNQTFSSAGSVLQ